MEMNNISVFLSAASRYGVGVSDLFQVFFCGHIYCFV